MAQAPPPPQDREEVPIDASTEERSLSPDERYIYTTPSDVEKFASVPYTASTLPKNNLSPPSSTEIDWDKIKRFCSKPKNKDKPICRGGQAGAIKFCNKRPKHRLCHDEDNPYNQYGFFNDTNPNIFVPELRNPVRKEIKKPINNMYENKLDDIQFDVPNVRITKCRCKDGSIAQGYINMRNGQKDCSNCQSQRN